MYFYLTYIRWKKKKKKNAKLPSAYYSGVFLTFTILWAYSAEDKLMIFFLFFTENRIWHFMQIVDNLHEISKLHWRQFAWNIKTMKSFSGKSKKKYFSMSSEEIFSQGPVVQN